MANNSNSHSLQSYQLPRPKFTIASAMCLAAENVGGDPPKATSIISAQTITAGGVRNASTNLRHCTRPLRQRPIQSRKALPLLNRAMTVKPARLGPKPAAIIRVILGKGKAPLMLSAANPTDHDQPKARSTKARIAYVELERFSWSHSVVTVAKRAVCAAEDLVMKRAVSV